jgi:glyoxylase-like metal-dependent hydrolase (beta-lactamase superfamily II)
MALLATRCRSEGTFGSSVTGAVGTRLNPQEITALDRTDLLPSVPGQHREETERSLDAKVSERIEYHEIEGLRVGRFASRINTTCIVYRIGSTVIDTGPPNQWRSVRRFLEEREVHRVIVTHHHEDHSGNLAPIRRKLDPEIYSPQAGIAPLRDGFALRLYQKVIWGRPDRVRPHVMPDEIEIGNGRSLRALPSPGHSTDMTCYLEAQRGWLFTGDLFISQGARYLRADEDVGAHIESLRRILTLDFETVFCSHRGVVRSGKEALRSKLDFLEELCERVRQFRNEGRGTREITRSILGREDLMSWMTGLHFSKRNLIRACLRATEPLPS